jgi:hypothetical protein
VSWIQLVAFLLMTGTLLWLVNNYVPMQGSTKRILNGVLVIAAVLWLLNVFGLFSYFSDFRVGG